MRMDMLRDSEDVKGEVPVDLVANDVFCDGTVGRLQDFESQIGNLL